MTTVRTKVAASLPWKAKGICDKSVSSLSSDKIGDEGTSLGHELLRRT